LSEVEEMERLIERIAAMEPESWSEAMDLVNLALERFEISNNRQRICSEIMRRLHGWDEF